MSEFETSVLRIWITPDGTVTGAREVVPGRDDDWRESFLIALERNNGKRSVAAKLCGVEDRKVRRRLRLDASFFQDVEAVYERLMQPANQEEL